MAEFRSSIEIDAAPDRVFDHLVTEDGMTAWMGQHARLVPEPGGDFAVDIAGHAVRGTYLRVERPSLVVVSWGVAGSAEVPPGTSTVEFRLTPTASGTRVELLHSGLPDTALDGHADGWEHFLPRWRTAATGVGAGEDTWRPGEHVPTLVERVRSRLAARSVREVRMFGGLAFVVDGRMHVHARRDGTLLVRVDPARSAELVAHRGARVAEMGEGRSMGPGWLEVDAALVTDDDRLAFWLAVAAEFADRPAASRRRVRRASAGA